MTTTPTETQTPPQTDAPKERLRIGMVLHKRFPPDPRVAREAKALIEAGHTVYLLSALRGERPEYEVIDNLHVVRTHLHWSKQRSSKILFVTVEPYNSKLNRIRFNFGFFAFSFKIPRLGYSLQVNQDHKSHTQVVVAGPIRFRIPQPWYRLSQWVANNRDIWQFWREHQFFDLFWYHEMIDFIDKYQVEVLHVHDLPLVYTGLQAAQARRIPCVADLHENWPALVHINRHKRKGLLQKWRNRKSRWEAHERLCLKQTDHVVVVADTAKERILAQGLPPHKVTVVSNTVDIDAFLAKCINEEAVNQYKDRFVVSYLGGFGPHRGIDTLLEAAKILKPKIPNLLLYLAGSDGPTSDRYLNYCKELAQELDIEDITLFLGWADDAEYGTYTALSDVGVIPHKDNEHTQTTMPNKIYSYMLMATPVICSDLVPLKAVLDETEAGLCFKASDAEDLAAQIETLYADTGLRAKMGESGRTWVYRKYNWGHDAGQLVRAYDTISQKLAGKPVFGG